MAFFLRHFMKHFVNKNISHGCFVTLFYLVQISLETERSSELNELRVSVEKILHLPKFTFYTI